MSEATKTDRRALQAERDRQMDEQLRANFYDPEKKKKRRKNVRIGFCITLVLLLVASVINWGVITGWGNVDIDRIKLSGNDGAEFSGLVYRPANATDDTPAPAVIMFHGNAGNARNHEAWAMEFARRGYVVVVPDLYGSGNSEAYFTGYLPDVEGPESMGAATGPESLIYEADMFYQYMLTLPYVDTDNILSTGHSMGGVPAFAMGAYYNAKGIIVAAGTSAWNFANATAETMSEDDPQYKYWLAWQEYDRNTVVLMGDVEHSKTLDPEQADKSIQQKGLPTLQKYEGYENAERIEPNVEYGSFEDGHGYAFIVEPQRIHEAAFVTTTTVGNLLNYGQQFVDEVPNPIDWQDQIWPIKDYTGLFGTFVFVAFLCAFALLLIEEVRAFEGVKRPLPRNVGFRGPGLIIASLVALLVPYLVIKTDAFGIVGGQQGYNLWQLGFHINYSNLGFGVIVGLTLVCILGTAIFLLTERKKKGLTPIEFGMTPADYDASSAAGAKAKAVSGMILRTALLAFIVVFVGWAYMALQVEILGTDFYSWFFGVKDIPISKFVHYLPYLVVFILAFVVLSIDMNVIRRLPTTGNETKDLIIAIVVNVVLATAVVIAIVAVKWYFQATGNAADTSWLWSMVLDTQRIWGLPVGMTCAVAGSTFLYKKTGNLWLCALLVGTIACIMGLLYGSMRFHYLTFYC